jgi:NitT/TauT family transport system permease protein
MTGDYSEILLETQTAAEHLGGQFEHASLADTEPLNVDTDVIVRRRRRRRERILTVLSPIGLVLLWELLATVDAINRRFFPAPFHIVGTFGHLIRTDVLWPDIRVTLYRIVVGLAMGTTAGLIVGGLMGLSRNIRAVVKPIIAALFPIPQIAVLPLIILIFGLGNNAKFVSIAIGTFFLMVINTSNAVMQIEDIYVDVGRNFGASRWNFFRKIIAPGAMPGILNGFQIALTVSLLICIAVEFLAATSGIGYLIWQSWNIFDVPAMYVGLVCCAALGFCFQGIIELLRRTLIPWKRNENH